MNDLPAQSQPAQQRAAQEPPNQHLLQQLEASAGTAQELARAVADLQREVEEARRRSAAATVAAAAFARAQQAALSACSEQQAARRLAVQRMVLQLQAAQEGWARATAEAADAHCRVVVVQSELSAAVRAQRQQAADQQQRKQQEQRQPVTTQTDEAAAPEPPPPAASPATVAASDDAAPHVAVAIHGKAVPAGGDEAEGLRTALRRQAESFARDSASVCEALDAANARVRGLSRLSSLGTLVE
jgi:colicin import membrane protein